MSSVVLQIIVSLFFGISLFLLIWSLFRFPVPSEPPVHRRIAAALGADQKQMLFDQPLLAPVMTLALVAAGRLGFPVVRRWVRQDLDASGNPHGYSVEQYLAICLLSAGSVGVISCLIALAYGGHWIMIAVLLMLLLGFSIPIWALHDAAGKRVMQIAKKLPYTLDLIALAMTAGSTFTEAIEAIIRDEPQDDLNQELKIVQAEVAFGTTRSTALSNLAVRIPLESLRSIVAAVNQAEALGTPLSAILKAQSATLRNIRSVRAEKLSATASLRILIPTMLILIAAVIVIFGPVLIRWRISGNLFG